MVRTRRSRRTPRKSVSAALIKGSDYVSAIVKSGQERFCYPKDIQKMLGRPLRITSLHVTATMLKGTTTLVEVALFNQGQTHVATSGPRMIVANKQVLVTVTPPQSADMWFDSGNLSSTSIKLFSLSVPCIDKAMSEFTVHFLARINYVQGEEVYDNACPAVKVLRDPTDEAGPELLGGGSISTIPNSALGLVDGTRDCSISGSMSPPFEMLGNE